MLQTGEWIIRCKGSVGLYSAFPGQLQWETSCWQQCRIDMHGVSSAAFTERQKGLGALFFSQSAFSWRAALVPMVFPLPDPQSLPSWGLFHCSISTKIPGLQCIWHAVHPQPKQALSKGACRWHPCPFQQGPWKTAHPLCNLSQGFLILIAVFTPVCTLGRTGDVIPVLFANQVQEWVSGKGNFQSGTDGDFSCVMVRDLWHIPLTSRALPASDTQTFWYIQFPYCVIFYLGDLSRCLDKHRNDSPWSWTSNPHVVRWIRWIHLQSDHIH